FGTVAQWSARTWLGLAGNGGGVRGGRRAGTYLEQAGTPKWGGISILNGLFLFVPVSLVLAYGHAAPIWVFTTAALTIIPLADLIRRSTEELAKLAGPAVGGLLNVSFGNLPELILALFILAEGRADVVKGQITGSIVGNSLLGLGLAILIGT